MDRKVNGHSAEYLKRQAKKIKKQLGITHLKALDKAAQNAGFTGWKHFQNLISADKVTVKSKQPIKKQLPKPSVLAFYPALSSVRHLRPNAKMPVAAHKELGAILKVLKNATEEHKRAVMPITDVAYLLDEWVQKENKGRKELSDDVFFELYYGDEDTETEQAPTPERKEELKKLCRNAKSIIQRNYHDCGPTRQLLKKLDNAIKWIDVWPAAKVVRQYGRGGAGISGGTLVYLKSNHRPAILISHQQRNRIVICYSDRGPVTTGREGVTVPKDQTAALDFKPMRLWLPYGKWKCADGTQVLFNRDYCPIWQKSKNGVVSSIEPDIYIEKEGPGEFYFNDRTAPWYGDKQSLAECIGILEKWGVRDKTNGVMSLLPKAIAEKDISLLNPNYSRNAVRKS